MNLGKINKVLVTVGALIVGVCGLAGVNVAHPVDVLVGIGLTLTPLVVYLVRNEGQIDAPFANKAIVTLGAAVVGVCMVFNVDVSEEVDQVVNAALAITPVLVFLVSNKPVPVIGPDDPIAAPPP